MSYHQRDLFSFTLVACTFVALMVGTQALAQLTTGTIYGTVTDPSGAVIPGGNVTARNVDTGFSRGAVSDEAGNYNLVNIPIGSYQVEVEMPGFKRAVSGPFRLIVDQRLRSDFKLEIGEHTETVQVSGVGTTLLQTSQSDVNQIVQEKEMKQLPLNGRDFFSLLLLSNGVQDTSNDVGGATTNVTFSINGMRPEANSVTLDGIEMSSIRESDVDLRPNLDAVSEFKVLTSNYSAEYGHTAGGVISIQSKAGTNDLHGTVFEFVRNDVLNAANFFRNPVNPEKAPQKRNMFGGSIGGPIQKNKTFFFVDYQGYRYSQINEAFAKVPEVAFRSGDFSSLLPDTGIFDPLTGGEVQFRDPSRATPGNPQGLNIIPPSRIHPFASALLNAVALPNLPNDFPLGNYFIRQPHRLDGNEAGIRVDHVFSERDNLFLRYRWNDSLMNTADALARPDGPMPGIGLEVGATGIVQGGTHRDRNNNMVISEIHVFNPLLVNEARLGFHRYHLDVFQHAFGMNLAEKFGLKGVNDTPFSSGLPIIYLNNYNSIGGDDWKPLFFRETSIQFNDNLSVTAGKHFLKVGGEYRRRDENNYFSIFPHGAFWVGVASTSYKGWWWQGHELADLLLGLPAMGFRGRRFASPLLRDHQYSFFLQDDWKVTDRLTLNLGLRYEYATPFYSPTNEIAMFDFDQSKMLIAGQDRVSRYIVEPDKNNWAPRIGLAYMIDPKTTVRAGFGIFYDPSNSFRDDIKFNPPFYRQYSTWMTWNFWSPAPPPFEDPGSFPLGYELRNIDRNFRIGYSEQYSLAVQRQLGWDTLLEIAYVGSQAHRLPYRYNFNQARLGGIPKPFPKLGTINLISNVGNSAYHSGQLKFERRFGEGFFFLTSYTWSKSIDNVSSPHFGSGVTGGVQNVFDTRQNRAVSDWDVPHRLAYSLVYDLPFGKGRRWLGAAHPLLEAFLGNWQTTGIFIASSGVPGTVSVGSTIPGGDARPNLIRDPNLPENQRTVERWFDTGAFVVNRDSKGNLLPGNAGRNIFRGPTYTNFDVGLIKFFPVSEQVKMQFRAEFFNLSNTPHFALPVRQMNNPAFGRMTHTRNPTNYGSTATSYGSRTIQFALKLEF